jgi:hypothetical protein
MPLIWRHVFDAILMMLSVETLCNSLNLGAHPIQGLT